MGTSVTHGPGREVCLPRDLVSRPRSLSQLSHIVQIRGLDVLEKSGITQKVTLFQMCTTI